MIGGDNVRITGLRIEGQDTIQDQLFEDVGLEVKSAIKATGRSGWKWITVNCGDGPMLQLCWRIAGSGLRSPQLISTTVRHGDMGMAFQ